MENTELDATSNAKRQKYRILVVEDDVQIAHALVTALRERGFGVMLASCGSEGLKLALQGAHDCMVLDRLLPKIDGLSILSTIRNVGIKIPVIILSALGATDERVRGLRGGANDYLTKPYSVDELTARIDVLLRRTGEMVQGTALRVGDLYADLSGGVVLRDGVTVLLKPREMKLLEFLMRNENQVVTRTMLFEWVWKYHHDVQTNVIDVHIARLRKKISLHGTCAEMIDTVRGVGYVLHA